MDNRYPIGQFTWTGSNSPEQRASAIADIEAAPRNMRNAIAGLNDSQLETPYRDGGWTVRQVVIMCRTVTLTATSGSNSR